MIQFALGRLLVVAITLWLGTGASVLAVSQPIERAIEDYRFQLSKYREEYGEFDLKRTQYENIQTFAALEELNIATRVMLLRRAGVWDAFLQEIKLRLLATQGVEESDLQRLIEQLNGTQELIERHIDDVSGLQQRPALLREAEYLNRQRFNLEATSAAVLSHIAVGQLEQVYEQERELSSDLQEAIRLQIRDKDVRERRLRGFEEVERSLDLAEADLSRLQTELDVRQFALADAGDAYEDLIGELIPVHGQLSRAHEFMSELAEGLQ